MNSNSWLFENLENVSLVFTIDGLFKDGEFSGSSYINNGKIYRPSQFNIIGNWFSWLSFLKNNYDVIENIVKEIYFDLNDHNMCADGFIGVENRNGSVIGCSVPFNYAVHEKINSIYKFY